MDMGTNKAPKNPLDIDTDLEKMTRDELIAEALRWRGMAPMIKDVCHELSDYRQIAPTPNDLKSHIDVTMQTYRNTIAEQAKVIAEQNQFIEEMLEDPLGVNKRLDQHTGRTTKKRLN